jgi:putative ABC transport system ATP-binding protein
MTATANTEVMESVAPAGAHPVIELTGVTKTYGSGEAAVRALDGVSLTIRAGEFAAIIGASGSGKTTLMNLLGLLDVPDAGRYALDGIDTATLAGGDLSRLRGRRIGFVFQSFNLIPTMTALANVELPMAYTGTSRRERLTRAKAALDLVGLGDRGHHKPNQLSGGQAQRVAVARALVNAPALILADEPTGNLDSASGAEVLGVLRNLHASGRTVVLITHDHQVAAQARRVIEMRDGQIVSDHATEAAP